jgi:uncharacterized membrane protein YraQ (UPF0718 family)
MASHRVPMGGLSAGVPAAAPTGGSGKAVGGRLRAQSFFWRFHSPRSETRGSRSLSMSFWRRFVRGAVAASGAILAADTVYKVVNDISYVSREKCVLFKIFPKPAFLVIEYLFETIMIVLVGVFLAVLLARGFARYARFLPRNPLTAFVYGSILPVCSCAVIPLVSTMRGRMRFATTMSLVLAAPLLSPYIIVLSFSVLGPTYGILRIVSSFGRRSAGLKISPDGTGCARACSSDEEDVYLRTLHVFTKLLPYLIVAAGVGILFEYLGPNNLLIRDTGWGRGPLGVLVWALMGVPLYFCHGAEVLFLRPLVAHEFPLGTAIAFSLTSTAICTTAIAMLLGMIGRRLTVILTTCILVVSLLLALLINGMM